MFKCPIYVDTSTIHLRLWKMVPRFKIIELDLKVQYFGTKTILSVGGAVCARCPVCGSCNLSFANGELLLQ